MKSYNFKVGGATVRATVRVSVDVDVKGLVYGSRERTWGVIKAAYAEKLEGEPHVREILQGIALHAPPVADPFEKEHAK
jgi:hypothetical protein